MYEWLLDAGKARQHCPWVSERCEFVRAWIQPCLVCISPVRDANLHVSIEYLINGIVIVLGKLNLLSTHFSATRRFLVLGSRSFFVKEVWIVF